MKKYSIPLYLLLCGMLLSACVSTVVEEKDKIPRMAIAQGGNGLVSIGWESRPDYVYTVYYQNNPQEEWKILRGANRISGNGSTLTVHDRVNPHKPPRRYRLLPEKK
jgi:hypothetical protein